MRQLKITKAITNRDSESLSKYLQEIGRYELISVEQEVELAQRIRGGDKKAEHELITANLRFVVSVAKQYQGQGFSLSDLINSGNMGLIKAAGRFDETRGFKFITFAIWWIRQSIMQTINEQARLVRLPINQVSLLNKYKRASSQFEQKNQRSPTNEEISDLYDFPKERLKKLLKASGRHVSFDSYIGHEEDNTLLDRFISDDIRPSDEAVMQDSNRQTLLRFIGRLSEREQYIIINFYGFNGPAKRPEEIADELKLSRERVRQIAQRAIMKLKTFKPQLKQQLN